MKVRMGFVSNSSSSSFVLDKGLLTPSHIKKIRIHLHYAKKRWGREFYTGPYDAWEISESEKLIELSTMMDNFDMGEFLRRIGADSAIVDREAVT